MDKKKIIIAGSIIAAIVLAYFGYQWYQKNKKAKETPVTRPTLINNGAAAPIVYQAPPASTNR